jgi:hypothetical protein
LKSKKALRIVLAAVIMTALLLTYFAASLLYGSNTLIFKVNPAANAINQIRNAEKTGDTLYLKSEDLNGILELYSKNLSSISSVNVEGCYANVNEGKISLFLPVRFRSVRLLLSTIGSVTFENNYIKFTPDSFKIGNIKLSKQFVLNKLKGYASDNISVDQYSIVINKEMIPFDFAALGINNNVLEVKTNKLTAETAKENGPATEQGNTNSQTSGNSSQTQQEKNTSILKKTSQQLKGAYSALKTDEGRQIISTIQAVVNKMIQNPSYAYQAEADSVKARYGKLSDSQRNDIKDAILYNLDINSLRTLKNTFGL